MRNRNFKLPGQPESTGENYEHYVRRQCAAYGLPPPLGGQGAEYQFRADRKSRFDFAWLDDRWLTEDGRRAVTTTTAGWPKIALEVEGGLWINGRHNRAKGYLEDIEKYSEAAILGWCLVRCVPEQVWSGEAILRVARAFAIRGYSVVWPGEKELAAVTFCGDVSTFGEDFDTSDEL